MPEDDTDINFLEMVHELSSESLELEKLCVTAREFYGMPGLPANSEELVERFYKTLMSQRIMIGNLVEHQMWLSEKIAHLLNNLPK